jgi:hypothetical protein
MAKALQTRNPEKYEYAYLLYMQRLAHKDICEKVNITNKTLTDWINKGGWDAKRAAKLISIDELVNKTLQKIGELLDSDDFNADGFAKAVAQLKSLKTTNFIDDDINCFMAFQQYLLEERVHDKTITDEFLKAVTKLQDGFILKRIGNGR